MRLLPQPDSPTSATISPGATSNETPSTTVSDPPVGPGTAIVRARTERSGVEAEAGGRAHAGESSLSRSPTSRNDAFAP